jgi:hypothetical protein
MTRSDDMKAVRASMKAAVTAMGLLLMGAMPAWAVPTFSLTALQTGSVLEVDVWSTALTDLYAYQFSLNFDPSMLQATSVSEGPLLATGGATFFDPGTTDNTAGLVSFVFDTLLGPGQGVTDDGVLAVILFDVQQTQVFTTLYFSDVLALDSELNELPVQAQGLRKELPEPGMLALLGIGLAVLTLGVRTQRR